MEPQKSVRSVLFSHLSLHLGGLGITAGAHRLWCHRAYKARLPLRIFLAFCNLLAFQNHIYEWARDHRVHHKFSETDADPHNSNRGFFFSHIGWLLVRKHPDVMRKGKTVDCSDLLKDPVVVFQKKYYFPLMISTCFVMTTIVPVYAWGEGLYNSFLVATLLRYTVTLHATWLVNSAAHTWGSRPYDKTIKPRQNTFVALFAIGEGFHNYHHTFPWDYSTSELGWNINLTTMIIDFMASIGQAYDLRSVPADMIQQRQQRTGDLN
ncbi:SCD [Cordylochernes scorpioides]|uniref:SCD n=1 Tax=Cordylochernes scorpioides TaxID=51811 RepID=A0ABY6KLL9_9ARAC|nr:SCD [Cordylochernes scorpioides]